MDRQLDAVLFEGLKKLVSENKKQLIEEVLAQRTHYVTVVLEHIQKPHNASAVLRTVEALGIQNFHMVAPRRQTEEKPDQIESAYYRANPGVVKGAIKWIDVHTYSDPERDNTANCLAALKHRGYAIAVTSPHAKGYFPEQLPIDKSLAVIFGNEQEGVSPAAIDAADYFLQIPMWGFTESYNLSVSAAICLYTLMNRIRNSPYHWQLGEQEKMELRLQWYRKLVRRSAIIESELLRNYDQKPD